jgi:hypothetical protein
VRIDETGGAAGASTDDYALEISKNSGGYAAITASSSNVKADTGSTLSDGSATTNRATEGISDPGAGSFVAGEQEAGNGVVEDRQLTADNFTEHVFALTAVRADVVSYDTLDSRVTLNGGAPGMTNTVIPRITVYKTQTGVYFDGTNDYLSGVDVTGAGAEDSVCTVSGWIKPDAGITLSDYIIDWSSNRFHLYLTDESGGDCRIELDTRDGGGTRDFRIRSDRVIALGQWNHFLISVDLVPATPDVRLYINDAEAEDEAYGNRVVTSGGTIDWNAAGGGTVEIGRVHSGANLLEGAIQEIFVERDTYTDFSVAANRRKFITADGKPVPLGSDGSTPTGTQPLIYLRDPYNSFETNYGSLGDFTVTGALTDEGTLPELPSVGAGVPVFMHHLKQMANN